ncbi:MAG: hypothetical protein JW969_09135 [Spirochaetales bacterium]|nr:hypothetical protein [Spirochaetales bacterium]
MKKILCIAVCIFLFTVPALMAENKPPKAVLKKGDVKKFLKTFPSLYKDLEDLGMAYNSESGDVAVPKAIEANAKFMALLKKNGWDKTFFQKMSVILAGLSVIVYDREAAEANPEMAAAIEEIEANPGLSAAMKKKMIDQMKISMGAMETQSEVSKKQIHQKDLAMIEPYADDLVEMLDSLED